MKKLIAFAILCNAAGIAGAQVIPTSATAPSSVTGINPIPSSYDASMKVNFIRTWEATRPFAADTSVMSSIRITQEVKQTTQYFDGLGRPLQVVSKQASPSGKDLVAPLVYDEFGREVFKYLSYIEIDSNTNNGKFKRNPFNEQASFYSNATYNPNLIGEQVYYSKSVFESSPLNRLDTSFAPGNSWGGSHVGILTSNQVNTLADSVRIWNIALSTGSTPTSSGYYSAGQLFKLITKDEHGKQVIEYKDKKGRTILKKVQIDNSPSSHHVGWLCTYYVYDILGNLRCVIQPKGVELRNGNWTLSVDVLNELCFRYEYDSRNRISIKKVPGAGEVWMVYDNRDRLVMAQDSALRAVGEWLYTKYDALNRPVLTGLWKNGDNRTYHEAAAANSSNYPNPNPGSGNEILTETYYDDYNWVSGSGSGLSSSFISTYAANTNYFYTSSNTIFPYPQAIEATYSTMGMVTGTRTKILGTSDFLYYVTFYDDRGRVIQTHSSNQSGGKDTTTMQYSFSGQLLRNLLCHGKAGTNAQQYKVLTKNEYDDGGRLIKISKKVGNSAETVMTENSYDELGQLKKKNIGQVRNSGDPDSYTSDPLDSLKYSYNIRGWLRGVNKDYARGTTSAGWFGTELAYDYGFSQTQLNGNIAGMRWRSKGDGEQRAYGFTYDAVNRFMQADFTQYTSSAWNTGAGVDFTVKDMSYDANGNILSMTQKGLKLTSSSVIDSLVYGYNGSTNKLHYVTDKTNDIDTQLGDFKETTNNTSQDYWYDGNGNLLGDNNKGISSITYNHLNLPADIKVNGKGTISYTYDASGAKLKKTTVDSSASPVKTTVTLYAGSFIYQNDTLQFAQTEEGRVRPKTAGQSDTMYYDYFEKDHLGNIRVVLTDELRTDAYPVASMETEQEAIEQTFYSNIPESRDGIPEEFTVDASYTDPNESAARLNGSRQKLGPGILLKVMAGDKFNLRVSSWMPYTGPLFPSTGTGLASELGDALSNQIEQQSGGKLTAGNISSMGSFTSMITEFLNDQEGSTTTFPLAFVSWIAFDERFNYDSASSGFMQAGINTILTQTNLPVSKNGYIYVFVSNTEADFDAFFDNLQVTHIRGPLLEETHYYPFGLRMTGINSLAFKFGGKENKYKFNDGTELNNKEFNDQSGLDIYETPFRQYDPQIGRFWQIDEMASDYENWSPFNFSLNNPILYNDPTGLSSEPVNCPDCPTGQLAEVKTLSEVVVRSDNKWNKMNYYDFSFFVDQHPDIDRYKLYNWLESQGANQRALDFYMKASDPGAVGYRAALVKWDEGFSSFIEDLVVEGATWVAGGPILKIAGKGFQLGYRSIKFFKSGSLANSSKGGLNLFKFNSPQALTGKGWRTGDRFLYLPNKGTPKLNWAQNSGRLRQEMRAGNPIFDSYKGANGRLLPTRELINGKIEGQFLNAERYLLQSRGWKYSENMGAWLPPIK